MKMKTVKTSKLLRKIVWTVLKKAGFKQQSYYKIQQHTMEVKQKW